jgi:uncharacterized protein
MDLARLIEHLSDPRVYSGATAKVDVHQTHISAVFVTDAFAYKIKKPVALEFLDYSTLEQRGHWCAQEVLLNRRMAPSIYLGVVPITQDGPNIRVEGTGSVVEWAVKMHRLPEEARLDSALARDEVSRNVIESLAWRVAAFHRHAERSESITRYGRFDLVTRNAYDNLDQSVAHAGLTVSNAVFDRLRVLTEESLGRLRSLIEDRAARGMPCDTHGDLRLDHVYLFPERQSPDDVAIVDCIEFNERFRAADPVADIAFLVMDLIHHGYREPAGWFREAYLAAAGDQEGRALVPFYVSYRAAVRAKVNGIKALEPEVPAGERERTHAEARAHWLLAMATLEEWRRRPGLVLVGGLPGTGKSTLAQALAHQAGFELIRSDQIRKELAARRSLGGVNCLDLGASGIYTPEWTENTYQACFDCSDTALFEGKRVLVDATFRQESHRRRFLDLAAHWGVTALLLICQVDPLVVKSRLEKRHDDVSDADWSIYLQTAERWEPLGLGTQTLSHLVDTSHDLGSSLNAALEQLRLAELWE